MSYATGFWCTRSWRGVWVPIDESFSLPTTADSVAGMAAELDSKLLALKTGGDAALERLDAVLRAATFHGAVFGTAYNTSYLIVVGEPSPLGQRPAHLRIEPGFVRADADSLLRVEYESRLPAYLARSRDLYATAEADGREAFRSVLDGGAGATSLRQLWRDGFNLAPQNWGSDFIAAMTQEYYDPFVRWSALYNFGLEAIARSAIVALAHNDAETALQALAGNMIFDGSWGSIQLGVLDGAVALPEVANGMDLLSSPTTYALRGECTPTS